VADIVISEFMDKTIANDMLNDHDLLFDPSLADNTEALYKSLSNARALIVRNRTQVDEALLAAAPNLLVIGRLGVGLDNIDLDACKNRNIAVCPATGANDLPVAEYVVTATLMLLRGAWLASERVSAGEWPRMALMGKEVSGKCMGLIGYGSIARETASRAAALGMNIIAYDPYLPKNDPAWKTAQPVELTELLKFADVISLHVPLIDETRHMINKKSLEAMKPEAVLINAARGGIVDEAALVTAIKNQQLAGAALDVFENEPLDSNHGLLFKDVQNLILTPHIAGVTKESNVRVSRLTIQNVLNKLL